MTAFYTAVAKNLSVSESVRKRGITGKAFIEMVVEPDGTTSNHKLVKGIDPEFDQVALNAEMNVNPRWNPGKNKGVPVRQKYVVPVALRD